MDGKGRVVVESADRASATSYHLASTHPVVVPLGRTHAMVLEKYTVFLVVTVSPNPEVKWEPDADKLILNKHLLNS